MSSIIALILLFDVTLTACGGGDDDEVGTSVDATETLGPVNGTPAGGGPTPQTNTFATALPTGTLEVDGTPGISRDASPDASPGATTPRLIVSPSEAVQGTSFTFKGTGLEPNQSYLLELRASDTNEAVWMEQVQSDADGTFLLLLESETTDEPGDLTAAIVPVSGGDDLATATFTLLPVGR